MITAESIPRPLKFILLLVMVCTIAGCPPVVPTGGPEPGDTEFKSASLDGSPGRMGFGGMANPMMDGAAVLTMEGAPADVAREIEEADLVKRIGTKLYLLNPYRGLRIVDLTDFSAPKLLGGVPFSGEPVDMYVVNDLAMVVVRNSDQCKLDPTGQMIAQSDGGGNTSMLYAIDISDPANPGLISTFDIDGYVVESRRVGEVIYFAGFSARPLRYYSPMEETDHGQSSFVVSINIADIQDVHVVQRVNFPGDAEYIHATTDAVFIADRNFRSDETTIQYVDISDPAGQIALRGNCTVPGRVLSRFSLDARGNVLRVVSEAGNRRGRLVALFTFDIGDPDNIASLAQLDIIRGETLHAVRFAENVCYVVTFRRIDPLWVINLTDPSAPAITGELEVPGFSTYLQPDGDKLIAMGVSADRRPAVALYDVSDPAAPVQLAVVPLGDRRSVSEANDDDKAFKVIPEAKLILAPFDTYSNEGPTNMLQMLDYSQDTLVKLAAIEHRGTAVRSGVDLDSQGLWVLSRQVLQTLNIEDRQHPVSLATLRLAENIIQYEQMGQFGLRLVASDTEHYDYYYYYYGQPEQMEVQLVDATDPGSSSPLSTLSFDLVRPKLIVVNEQLACLVGSGRDRKTRVICIDLGDASEIKVVGDKTFDFEMGWRSPYLMSFDEHNNPLLLDNGVLGFVAFEETTSLAVSSRTVLKLVSLTDPADPTVVSSVTLSEGISQLAFNMAADGNNVYLTTAELSIDPLALLFGRLPQVSYLLEVVDCSNPAAPQTRQPINVPGIVIYFDGNKIYTLDPQWTGQFGDLDWRFCASRLVNAAAVLQGLIDLPDGNPNIVMARSGLAVLGMDHFWYGQPIPMDMDILADGAISAIYNPCSSGVSTLVSIDATDPSNLRIASQDGYPSTVRPLKMNGDWLIGQSSASRQGILWRIGDGKELVVDSVFDLPALIADLAWREGLKFVDLACGFSGIETIELPSD